MNLLRIYQYIRKEIDVVLKIIGLQGEPKKAAIIMSNVNRFKNFFQWAGRDKESCNSQAWSGQRKWRWWMLFWYRGMDGYSEADEYGNSKIW